MPPDVSQSASPRGHGNVVVQVAGDGNVIHYDAGRPALWLATYDSPLHAKPASVAPSPTPEPGFTATGLEEAGLLRPYTRSFALRGRDGVLAELRAWRDAAAPVSVLVLTGAGGRGKTRLALELCREAAGQDWLAGFVTHEEMERFAGQQAIGAWGWPRDTLAVVDYAAGKARALRRWLEALTHHPALSTPDHPRLRLLLLNREGDAGTLWWKEAFGEGGASAAAIRRLLARPGPLSLDPVARAEDRQAIFAEAYRQACDADPPPLMEADRLLMAQSLGGEPLFLAMSGLIAAKQGIDFALRLRADQLALSLAADELDRIQRIWRGRGLPETGEPALPARIAAAATAAKGITGAASARALCAAEAEAAGLALPAGPETARAALHAALPAPDGGIAAIEPDILGEAALILTWGDGEEGLAALRRVAATHRAEATGIVIRACQDFLIRGERRPMAWLEALRAGATEFEALIRLTDAMPHVTLELRETALALSEVLVDLAKALAQDAGEIGQPFLAASLNNLSVRLSNLGRREAALAASEEAVAIRRTLAAAHPDAFLPDLAQSLNNLSVQLSDHGRREAALAAIEEAVATYRDLAAAHPDAFLPDLATSLNNLSNSLSDLGRREAALAAIEEAVAIRRTLAAARPDAFLPDLASSLNNLSNSLSDLGRREAALAAIEEAVATTRTLAAARPDAFLPDLASSLNNLSNRLSDLGRREAALAAIEKAVATYRTLAAARPDAFLPNLASSLSNLSNRLSDLGRREAALAASEEAVATTRTLAAARPDAFLPDLAKSLNNLSNRLSDLGRREAALAASEEAVATYRTLAAARPDAFLPNLASSLNNLSNSLSNLGRREAALAAIEEAVATTRTLAAARPNAFLPDLAKSLGARGQILRTSDPLSAAASFGEGVEILRDAFLALPAAFAPLIGALCRGYLESSEKAGLEPDMMLLGPIAEAFKRLNGGSGDGPEQAG